VDSRRRASNLSKSSKVTIDLLVSPTGLGGVACKVFKVTASRASDHKSVFGIINELHNNTPLRGMGVTGSIFLVDLTARPLRPAVAVAFAFVFAEAVRFGDFFVGDDFLTFGVGSAAGPAKHDFRISHASSVWCATSDVCCTSSRR
jgi:hypothetical protein